MNISVVIASFILVVLSITQPPFIVLHNFIVTGFYTYKYTCIIHPELNDLIQCSDQFSKEKSIGWSCRYLVVPRAHPSFVDFWSFRTATSCGNLGFQNGRAILNSNLNIQHYCLSDYTGYRRVHVLILLKIKFENLKFAKKRKKKSVSVDHVDNNNLSETAWSKRQKWQALLNYILKNIFYSRMILALKMYVKLAIVIFHSGFGKSRVVTKNRWRKKLVFNFYEISWKMSLKASSTYSINVLFVWRFGKTWRI